MTKPGDGIPVTVACRVLKIARQPYYRWLANPVTDAELATAYRANAVRSNSDLLPKPLVRGPPAGTAMVGSEPRSVASGPAPGTRQAHKRLDAASVDPLVDGYLSGQTVYELSAEFGIERRNRSEPTTSHGRAARTLPPSERWTSRAVASRRHADAGTRSRLRGFDISAGTVRNHLVSRVQSLWIGSERQAPGRRLRSLDLTSKPSMCSAQRLWAGKMDAVVNKHQEVAIEVVTEQEAAHSAEDVPRYVALFAATATWITSRGVLIERRDALEDYLAQVRPGGLSGGAVECRAVSFARVGEQRVVVVVDQVYRQRNGKMKATGGRHRHTYEIDVDDAGVRTIVAGQNTTMTKFA